jgi:hypothetical protein
MAGVVREIDPATYRPLPAVRNWNGPEDLSAQLQVGWEPEALYLGANITMLNTPKAALDPRAPYRGRGLEVWLSLDPLASLWTSEPQATDYRLQFAPGEAPNTLALYAWKGTGEMVTLTGAELAFTPWPRGWQVEVRIPWTSFPGMQRVPPGTVFGLDAALEGIFPNGDRQYRMTWSGVNREGNDFRNLGALILVGK